jgi:hypothetical protein
MCHINYLSVQTLRNNPSGFTPAVFEQSSALPTWLTLPQIQDFQGIALTKDGTSPGAVWTIRNR